MSTSRRAFAAASMSPSIQSGLAVRVATRGSKPGAARSRVSPISWTIWPRVIVGGSSSTSVAGRTPTDGRHVETIEPH